MRTHPWHLDFNQHRYIVLLFHTSRQCSVLMPGSSRGHVHRLNKCKWWSCNSAGGFFYCPPSSPTPSPLPVPCLHPRRPRAPTQRAFRSSGSRDNKSDSLLVLRFIIVVALSPSPSQEAQFQGECLCRVCTLCTLQCSAMRRDLHQHLTDFHAGSVK